MQKLQPESCCSICDKPVTLLEDICVDENGKAVHRRKCPPAMSLVYRRLSSNFLAVVSA